MKTIQLLTLVIFTSALMGCQLEVSPIDAGTDTGTTEITDNETSNDQGSNQDTSTDTGNDIPKTSDVTLYWSAPLERVNGNVMTSTDIGGYEIRYKKDSDTTYQQVVINDAATDQHSFSSLASADSYTFEVAVFDADGIYSDFVVAIAN